MYLAVRIFFVDDSGNRRGNPKEPYFCLGGFSIHADDLKQLGHRLGNLKRQWRLAAMPEDEIKFNQIGRDHDHPKRPNPLVRVGYDRAQRIQFGQAVLTHLVRFEFSLNSEVPRVGLIICDTEDTQDEMMRRALYSGTVWTSLPNIAETVMFVPSHHSPGVQFADFVAGAMGRWWNYRDDKYLRTLAPRLQRTRVDGRIYGAGLKSFRRADYPTL